MESKEHSPIMGTMSARSKNISNNPFTIPPTKPKRPSIRPKKFLLLRLLPKIAVKIRKASRTIITIAIKVISLKRKSEMPETIAVVKLLFNGSIKSRIITGISERNEFTF